MNNIILVTSNVVVIEELDKTFEVATVTPNSSRVGEDNYEVLLMDSRSKSDMRTEIHNIYKRKAINTDT